MEGNGCSPSVVTYSLLVHGLCQTSKLEEELELLKEKKSKDIDPNVYTYSSLIRSLQEWTHFSGHETVGENDSETSSSKYDNLQFFNSWFLQRRFSVQWGMLFEINIQRS